MQIGDKYSDGIITNMEMDENKLFWIEVAFPPNNTITKIDFKKPRKSIEQEETRKITISWSEYVIINENYKKMLEENNKLKDENKRLNRIINDLLNAKV